jgi:hypothetical protein
MDYRMTIDPNTPRDANDFFAAWHYKNDEPPLVVAEKLLEPYFDALLTVVRSRAADPDTFPGYGDVSPALCARRVMATLLACGWAYPGMPMTAPTTEPENL